MYEIVQIGGNERWRHPLPLKGGFGVLTAAQRESSEQHRTYHRGVPGFGFGPIEGGCPKKGAGMDTAREYRQRAVACLRLAKESREAYVKVALTELASKFSSLADSVEPAASIRAGRKRLGTPQ